MLIKIKYFWFQVCPGLESQVLIDKQTRNVNAGRRNSAYDVDVRRTEIQNETGGNLGTLFYSVVVLERWNLGSGG